MSIYFYFILAGFSLDEKVRKCSFFFGFPKKIQVEKTINKLTKKTKKQKLTDDTGKKLYLATARMTDEFHIYVLSDLLEMLKKIDTQTHTGPCTFTLVYFFLHSYYTVARRVSYVAEIIANKRYTLTFTRIHIKTESVVDVVRCGGGLVIMVELVSLVRYKQF